MSTLIRKELRENFKVALIGFALFTFMLVQSYRACTGLYADLAAGQGSWNSYNAQPLIAGSVTSATGVFCAIFGAILGWLQIHSERHRDLWAFLVHRPLSRTKIFGAKTVAGLCLYAAGAGVPLLGLILMTVLPGRIAAPFEWAMVLPVAVFFLTGIVFYFAGMLTSVRQARWYASRGLGLGAAFVVSVALANAPEFSRAFIFVLVAGVVMATAAWGSFVAGGYYEGQPAMGRGALAVSLSLGCLVVVGLAIFLIESMLPAEKAATWSRYQIATNGVIYKVTQPPGKPMEITEFNRAPVGDTKTGQTTNLTELVRVSVSAPEVGVWPDFRARANVENWSFGGYQQLFHYFTLWRQTPDTLWYLNRNGRLWAYDIASRRFSGSLGPDGFVAGSRTGAARFTRPEGQFGTDNHNASYPARTLMTDRTVYLLDLEHRAIKPFFTAADNDRIGGAEDVTLRNDSWDYTLVVTTNFVHLLTPDGKSVWQTPYSPGYPKYIGAVVSFLEPSNRFALTFNPPNGVNKTNGLPLHVVWLAAGQGAIRQQDLPSIAREWKLPWSERVVGVAMPPAFWPITGWLYGNWFIAEMLQLELRLSLACAALCAVVGWWLGWRYHFTLGAQLKWAVFHLLTGLPGLLGFLCVQEWPGREACPGCKELRLVDREKCEHCGADFAPPAKIGTEIFEQA